MNQDRTDAVLARISPGYFLGRPVRMYLDRYMRNRSRRRETPS